MKGLKQTDPFISGPKLENAMYQAGEKSNNSDQEASWNLMCPAASERAAEETEARGGVSVPPLCMGSKG